MRLVQSRQPRQLLPSATPKDNTTMPEDSRENHLHDASRQIVNSPIPLMPGYFSNEAEKNRFIANIFDDTAADYDRMERILGLGIGSRYRGEYGALHTGAGEIRIGQDHHVDLHAGVGFEDVELESPADRVADCLG